MVYTVVKIMFLWAICLSWGKIMILVSHDGMSHKDYHVTAAVTEYCRLLVYLFICFSFFLSFFCFAVLAGFFIHSKYEGGIICMNDVRAICWSVCLCCGSLNVRASGVAIDSLRHLTEVCKSLSLSLFSLSLP